MMKNVSLLPVLLACLGAMFVGASPIFVRISDLGPVTTGFYRMVFALPFLFIWMMIERKKNPQKISFKEGATFGIAGLAFGLDLALWNWSIDYTTIVNSTLFNNTAIFFVPFIAWGIFRVKPTKRLVQCVVAAMLGSILLFHESFNVNLGNMFGDMVALASGFMVAIYVITIKNIRNRVSTGTLMFWSCIPTIFVLGIIAMVFKESFIPLTINDGISIFGQSILVHVLGQGFLAYALGFIPASYGAIILLLAPTTAALLGFLVYEESLSALQALGIIIILLSIILVKEKKKPYQMGTTQEKKE